MSADRTGKRSKDWAWHTLKQPHKSSTIEVGVLKHSAKVRKKNGQHGRRKIRRKLFWRSEEEDISSGNEWSTVNMLLVDLRCRGRICLLGLALLRSFVNLSKSSFDAVNRNSLLGLHSFVLFETEKEVILFMQEYLR